MKMTLSRGNLKPSCHLCNLPVGECSHGRRSVGTPQGRATDSHCSHGYHECEICWPKAKQDPLDQYYILADGHRVKLGSPDEFETPVDVSLLQSYTPETPIKFKPSDYSAKITVDASEVDFTGLDCELSIGGGGGIYIDDSAPEVVLSDEVEEKIKQAIVKALEENFK